MGRSIALTVSLCLLALCACDGKKRSVVTDRAAPSPTKARPAQPADTPEYRAALARAEERLAQGGEFWSIASTAKLGNHEDVQPGNRYIILPAMGDGTAETGVAPLSYRTTGGFIMDGFEAEITLELELDWVLREGQDLPKNTEEDTCWLFCGIDNPQRAFKWVRLELPKDGQGYGTTRHTLVFTVWQREEHAIAFLYVGSWEGFINGFAGAPSASNLLRLDLAPK